MGVLTVPINEEIMACGTWSEVLDYATRRCMQMDELNIVTALHRAAKLYRDEDQGRTPLREVQEAAGLATLLEHTRHFLPRCRPQQLSNSIWACAVLLCRPSTLLQGICDYATRRLAGYTPQNVANTIWAMATLGLQHEELLTLVVKYVEVNVLDFSPQDLANSCWAFAKLQRPCDALFSSCLAESLVKLDSFQAQNMSNLIWGCATVLYRDDAAVFKIAEFAAGRVGTFSTQELSNLTWGMATLNLLSELWLDASGVEMARRAQECCPQDLSNTLWAYGTLKYKRNDVVRTLNWEVMHLIGCFSPQGLSNVAWGLSAMEYRDQLALTCICEEVMRRPVEQMTPPDISTLLYSFAVLAWQHEGALAQLRRAVRFHLPRFATRDVANVSWSLVILSHRDDGIFRKLMARAGEMMPDFNVQGLCNIAWAFVRFGVEVPAQVARGIAEETVKRREDLLQEPGDAVLLSDAVCSEWSPHVPQAVFDVCDAIGREHYMRLLTFLLDWSNIPAISCSPGDAERYQQRIIGFNCIQLGRRLTVELFQRLGMWDESPESNRCLRSLREEWLLEELKKVEPTDATIQHKTVCSWALASSGQEPDRLAAEVLASGSPLDAEVRFVACAVEHPRNNDAEFQVVNKAAERILCGEADGASVLHINVSEIPCFSCLGALRQFQKAFPKLSLKVSFSIRKVCEVCSDRSVDTLTEPAPRDGQEKPHAQSTPDNRSRPAGAHAAPPRAPSSSRARTSPPPHVRGILPRPSPPAVAKAGPPEPASSVGCMAPRGQQQSFY